MELEWQAHARERLHERGISERLVREAVRDPEQIIGRGTHRVLQRRYLDATRGKEYLLRVFVEIHGGVTIVRSVYRTSKIRKYWRRL